MMYTTRNILGLCLLGMASSAFAIDPLPQESGFSGFIKLGGAANRVESNMVAGTFFGNVANRRIDSIFDSPEDKSSGTPTFDFNLGYTFKTRTQVFLGRELVDVFRFDFSTAIGVKQELPDKSTLGLSLMLPTLPTKVWEDPYVENQRRNKTDRDASGVRVAWRDILGSAFEGRVTYRKVNIDDERSGTFLGLSLADQKLLDREGDFYEGQALYRWDINERHRLSPALLYTYFDADGRAMKNDSWGGQLTYSFRQKKRPVVVANLFYARVNYDETNPIYNDKQEDDRYGVAAQYLYYDPFGFEDWAVVFSAAYYKEDSNIDFYDAEVLSGGVSALYKF